MVIPVTTRNSIGRGLLRLFVPETPCTRNLENTQPTFVSLIEKTDLSAAWLY
jgi:hypothetical protein